MSDHSDLRNYDYPELLQLASGYRSLRQRARERNDNDQAGRLTFELARVLSEIAIRERQQLELPFPRGAP